MTEVVKRRVIRSGLVLGDGKKLTSQLDAGLVKL